MKNRPKIPRATRRNILIQSGYECTIPGCRIQSGIQIHHIDNDPKNNAPDNLLALCPIHHYMVTDGIIDRKACRIIKGYLSLQSVIPTIQKNTLAFHSNRSKYNDAVIGAIKAGPKLLRAIIIGPHFLHPQWVFNRRLERERRDSFSFALHKHLEDSLDIPGRNIRLILRNSPRYIQLLRSSINSGEISRLVTEMKDNMYKLFSPVASSGKIKICCTNPGFFHQVIIADDQSFIASRQTEDSRIKYGMQLRDKQFTGLELKRFDDLFNANYRGNKRELADLEKYIKSLPKFI